MTDVVQEDRTVELTIDLDGPTNPVGGVELSLPSGMALADHARVLHVLRSIAAQYQKIYETAQEMSEAEVES